MNNLTKHAFEIVSKLSVVFDVFSKKDEGMKISHIYESVEAIGESMGEIESGLIGFQ